MPMAVAFGAADWLNLAALQRYPKMKICLSESGIGWIPYLMERADYSHEQHHVWTHSNQYFGDEKPQRGSSSAISHLASLTMLTVCEISI